MYSRLQALKNLLADCSSSIDYTDRLVKQIDQLLYVLQDPLQHKGQNEESLGYLNRGQYQKVEVEGYGAEEKFAIPKEYLQDALAISRAMRLDEKISVELVFHGSLQLPFYPAFTRGLIAVMLLYDCKLMTVECLFHLSLLCSRDDCPEQIQSEATKVFSSSLFTNILNHINTFTWENAKQYLSSVNGIGGNRHSHEIRWRISKIRSCCGRLFQTCSDRLQESDINCIFQTLSNGSIMSRDQTSPSYCCNRDLFFNNLCEAMLNAISQWFSAGCTKEATLKLISATCQQIQCRQNWVSQELRALFRFTLYVHIRWSNNFLDKCGEMLRLESNDDLAIEASVEQGALLCIQRMRENLVDCSLAWSHVKATIYEDVFLRHQLLARFLTVAPGYVEELRFRVIRDKNQSVYEQLLQCFSTLYSSVTGLSALTWTSNYEGIDDLAKSNVRKFLMSACDVTTPSLVPSVFKLLESLSKSSDGSRQTFNVLTGFLNNDDHYLSINRIFHALHMYCKSMSQIGASNTLPLTATRRYDDGTCEDHRLIINTDEHDALVCALQAMSMVVENCNYAASQMVDARPFLKHDIVQVLAKLVSLPMPLLLKASAFNLLAGLFKQMPTLMTNRIRPVLTACIRGNGLQHEIGVLELSEQKYPLFRGVLGLICNVLQTPESPCAFDLTDILKFICAFSIDQLASQTYFSQSEEYSTVYMTAKAMHEVLRNMLQFSAGSGNRNFIHVRREGLRLLHSLGHFEGPLSIVLQVATKFTDRLLNFSSIEDIEMFSRAMQEIFDVLLISLVYQKAIEPTVAIQTSIRPTIAFPVDALLLHVENSDSSPKFLFSMLRFLQGFHDFSSQCKSILDSVSILCKNGEDNVVSFLCKSTEIEDSIHESFLCILDAKAADSGEEAVSAINEAYCRRKVLEMILTSLEARNGRHMLAHYLLSVEFADVLPEGHSLTIPNLFDSSKMQRSCFPIIWDILQNSLSDEEFYSKYAESSLLAARIVLALTDKDVGLSTFILPYLRELSDLLVCYVEEPDILKEGDPQRIEFVAHVLRLLAVDLRSLKGSGQVDKLRRVQAILTHEDAGLINTRGPLISTLMWQLNGIVEDTYAFRREQTFQEGADTIDSLLSSDGACETKSFDWNGRTFQTRLIDVNALEERFRWIPPHPSSLIDSSDKERNLIIQLAKMRNQESSIVFSSTLFVCCWAELVQVMQSAFPLSEYSRQLRLLKEYECLLKEIGHSGHIPFNDYMLPFSVAMCFTCCALYKCQHDDFCSEEEFNSITSSLNECWQTMCHQLTLCSNDKARGFLLGSLLALSKNVSNLTTQDRNRSICYRSSSQTVQIPSRLILMLSRNVENDSFVNQSLSVSLLSVIVHDDADFLHRFFNLGCVDQLLEGICADSKKINRILSDDHFFCLLKSKMTLLLSCVCRTLTTRSLHLLNFNKLLSVNTLSSLLSLRNQSSPRLLITNNGSLVLDNVNQRLVDLFRLFMQAVIFCLTSYDIANRIDVKLQITGWLSQHEELLKAFIHQPSEEVPNDFCCVVLSTTVVRFLASHRCLVKDQSYQRAVRCLTRRMIDSGFLDADNFKRRITDLKQPTKWTHLLLYLRSINNLISCMTAVTLQDLKGGEDKLVKLMYMMLAVRKSLYLWSRTGNGKKKSGDSTNSSGNGTEFGKPVDIADFDIQLAMTGGSEDRQTAVELIYWLEQTIEQIILLIWFHLDMQLAKVENGLIGRLTNLSPHNLSDQTFARYSRIVQGCLPLSINSDLCAMLSNSCTNEDSSKPKSSFSEFLQIMLMKMSRLTLFITATNN